jgi:hypothetical protein
VSTTFEAFLHLSAVSTSFDKPMTIRLCFDHTDGRAPELVVEFHAPNWDGEDVPPNVTMNREDVAILRHFLALFFDHPEGHPFPRFGRREPGN